MQKRLSTGEVVPAVAMVDGDGNIVTGGGGGGGGGTSNTTEATQIQVRNAVQAIDADIGAPVDAAAPDDGTGNYTLIAAVKRALLNWAALLPRIPTLGQKNSAGSIPVVLPSDQPTLSFKHADPPFVRVAYAETTVSGLAGYAAQILSVRQIGPGMTVAQNNGNLVVTTGTTANSETVIRSQVTFSGSLMARFKAILSQRIANQVFRFELADLIGDNLAYTINSATSVTVTIPSNPFTAESVGQFLRLSTITGAAGVPGRYAIASVSGNDVTFTVAGWPASGTGTLTVYGLNWIAAEYSGTTATAVNFDAQRRGWNSGATAATINTTASPGHVVQLAYDVHTAGLADAVVASSTSYQWSNRATRIENIPDPDVQLYAILVVQNGTTAPASTTTLTSGFFQIEDQGRQKVRIASSDPSGSHALPVQVQGGSLALTGNPAIVGQAAEDAATTSNPVIVGGVVRTAVAPTTLVAGDVARHTMTSGAAMVVKQYAPQQVEFAPSLALTTTTATAIAAAAAAGIRNHLTSFWAINTGAATVDLIILDGATERARYPLPINVPINVIFPTGLLTTAATALNANLSAAGTVRANFTGYTSS